MSHEPLQPLHPSVTPLLDPDFISLYNTHVAHTPARPIDLAVLRKIYSRMYGYATGPAPDCGEEFEFEVDGWDKYPGKVKVRAYVPAGEPRREQGWGVHFDFHGGGWALGDLETESHICRHICSSVPCLVLDISYRVLPELPFPVGIQDSLQAVTSILSSPSTYGLPKINASAITLGGVSAGGNIALILNHLLRDAGVAVKAVVVGTPTIADLSKYEKPEDAPYRSLKEMEFAPLLNWARLKWFDGLKWDSLSSSDVEEKAQREKDASWFRDAMDAPDCSRLADLTVVMTAECDPLRDEGEAYARKLEDAGNKVVVRRFKGVPHPFQHMDGVLEQGKEFIEDTVRYIKSVQ